MNIEFKIGKIFGYKGVLLKVVKQDPNIIECRHCYWENTPDSCHILKLACCNEERKDNNDVIFMEVDNAKRNRGNI